MIVCLFATVKMAVGRFSPFFGLPWGQGDAKKWLWPTPASWVRPRLEGSREEPKTTRSGFKNHTNIKFAKAYEALGILTVTTTEPCASTEIMAAEGQKGRISNDQSHAPY